ncbi:MAG: glycosyltransferase family 9 protein [Planctomycetota bacterium]
MSRRWLGRASSESGRRPLRLLVVLPSWVGDAVMATPTLRVLRELLPSTFIGAMMKPGIEQVLAGTSFFDEWHVESWAGFAGPPRVARAVAPKRYDTAMLLPGSLSSALTVLLAGIPRRIGYARDARGVLLTETIEPWRRRDVEPYRRSGTRPAAWAPIPAADYYFALAEALLGGCEIDAGPMGPLELVCTRDEELAAAELLESAGIPREDQRRTPLAMLNPGGNNPAKRWPPERFAAVGDYLARHHSMRVLVSGSPAEAALATRVAEQCAVADHPLGPPIVLPELGLTLGKLKGVVKRCRVIVTNDTGPRHIAAAFGVPVVSLFGPTDHRWTTIPFEDEAVIRAAPDLPDHEVANDHPERCRIERIGLGDVVAATNKLLGGAAAR